jgi:hypothetical protein
LPIIGRKIKLDIAEHIQASFSAGRPYGNSSKIASAKSEKCRVLTQPFKTDSLGGKKL